MIRRLFWLIVLVCGYFWVLTSGHDEFFVAKAKAIWETVVSWVHSADSDFNLKKPAKKRARRWD